MEGLVTVDDLCNRALEIESLYDLEPIRHMLGFSITNADFINKPDISVILSDEDREKVREINIAEESLNPISWKNFLDSRPIEKVECVDNPNVFHACTDRFECPVCKLTLPCFDYFRLHSFGRVHTQRLRRLAIRERKVTYLSSWDRLIQTLYEAQIQLSFVNFEYWSMPERKFMLRMSIGDYKFQTTGFNFKDMRLKVIDKAVDFTVANLSLHGGFRLVRYPHIPEIERPPVVIDSIPVDRISEIKPPSNDNPSVAVEIISMACIDYIGCLIAKDERNRYCDYLKDISRRYLLTISVSYCDLCDNRISIDLCESHICSRRHFDQSFHLTPLRHCIEESLVRGIDLEEIEGYDELSTAFKDLERAYQAPFELCDLQKRYCPFFCAFCKASIRHPTDLEKHVRLSSHARNMLAKDASSDEHDKNRNLLKDHIRNLLIPSEYKQTLSVDLLPEEVRARLPLGLYSDDLIEKSIESALQDPEAHIKRCMARFDSKQASANHVGGAANKKRKRPNVGVGFPRNIRLTQPNATKRFRENPVTRGLLPHNRGSTPALSALDKLRAPYGGSYASARASMAALSATGEEGSVLESRRLLAAEELRRRRNFSRLLSEDSPLYHGGAPSLYNFGVRGRFGQSAFDGSFDDDDSRSSISDRLRNSAANIHYPSAGRTRNSGFNFGGQWGSNSQPSPYYDCSQQWGSPDDAGMAYMPPDYSSSGRHMPQPYHPTSDRRFGNYSNMGTGGGFYRY